MGMHEDFWNRTAVLTVNPIGDWIGAEIPGVRLGGDLDLETVAAIRLALFRHKVLFFRGQHHLTDDEQEKFGKLLGELAPHPIAPALDGTEAVLNIVSDDAAERWHRDVTFIPAFPLASILRAVSVPPRGGETMWANTAAAYRKLPAPLRDLADKLWMLHTDTCDQAGIVPGAPAAFATQHPLVQLHPETGERAMVLGHFAQEIVGLSSDDSARLIGLFQDHIRNLENAVRWSWLSGDVVIWDNRATQHYGIRDFVGPREMRRVTVEGDVPVSVDGRHSVVCSRRTTEPPLKMAAE
jgi:taurine dioxygenase